MKLDLGDLNWGLISKHRTKIMGLAIIWIVLYHGYATNMIFPEKIDFFNVILKRGNNGVDIFLFLSGIGLYYSYHKNPDKIKFYKKRFVRILIPYFLISGIFWAVRDIVINKDVIQFVKNISLYSFWSEGNIRVWFIALILPLYLVFPYIYKFLYKDEKGIAVRTWILLGGCIVLNTLISCFLPEWYTKVEIALTRVPIFIWGVFLGKRVKEEKALSFTDGIILVSLFNLKLFFNMYKVKGTPIRYWYGVLAIYICIFLCMIFEVMKRNAIMEKCNKLLEIAGTWSLEMYMVHIWIRRIFISLGFNYVYNGYNFNKYGILNYLLVILTSILVTFLFALIENRLLYKGRK